MFPLRDDNPTTITPGVTWVLIALCSIVFLYQVFLEATLGPQAYQLFSYQYGAVPAVVLGTQRLPASVAVIPGAASLFTCMFLHGSWMHLIGNMWFLWIFGNNIEEAMGHLRFLAFYFLCGGIASVSQILICPHSTIPTIGASGAIAGVMGAYLMLYPRARVWTLIFLVFFIKLIYLPAGVVLGFWILLQFVNGSMSMGQSAGGVAFWAHIGGFVSGVLLVGLFKQSRVRFFNPPRRPDEIYYSDIGDRI
jgi:membrane associated rhomboid family serine protease